MLHFLPAYFLLVLSFPYTDLCTDTLLLHVLPLQTHALPQPPSWQSNTSARAQPLPSAPDLTHSPTHSTLGVTNGLYLMLYPYLSLPHHWELQVQVWAPLVLLLERSSGLHSVGQQGAVDSL